MPRTSKRQAAKAAADEAEKKSKASYGWKMEWKEVGEHIRGVAPLLVYDGEEAIKSTKVAAFDMDGTIIKTRSGRRFPTGPSDWQLWDPAVLAKLRDLHAAKTKVVFFTNQAGIEKKNTTVSGIQSKIGPSSHANCFVCLLAVLLVSVFCMCVACCVSVLSVLCVCVLCVSPFVCLSVTCFVLLYCLSSPTGIAFVPPKTTGDILDTLAIPVTVLVCTGYNHYRKPSVLIWEYFEQHCNGDKRIDLKSVSLSLSGCLQP